MSVTYPFLLAYEIIVPSLLLFAVISIIARNRAYNIETRNALGWIIFVNLIVVSISYGYGYSIHPFSIAPQEILSLLSVAAYAGLSWFLLSRAGSSRDDLVIDSTKATIATFLLYILMKDGLLLASKIFFS